MEGRKKAKEHTYYVAYSFVINCPNGDSIGKKGFSKMDEAKESADSIIAEHKSTHKNSPIEEYKIHFTKEEYANSEMRIPTPEEVAIDGGLLRFVEEQNAELCLAAVKSNGLALKYVKKPNDEIIEAAILQNGNAIHFVTDPSIDLIKKQF